VLAVLRFEASDEDETFVDEAVVALRLLAARPGFRSGQLVRAYDQPGPALASKGDEERTEGAVSLWCLVTEWESVGAYRRAVGSYDVRSVATPLLSRALSEPSAFEPLATAELGDDGATVRLQDSDRSIGSRT
jgi:hypothetical protein